MSLLVLALVLTEIADEVESGEEARVRSGVAMSDAG